MVSPEVRNLQAPSAISIFTDPKTGRLTVEGHRFLQLLWERVGASSGDSIYNTIDLTQSTSASEAQLFAVRQDLEQQLQGIVLQMIEQVRETTLDPTGLITSVSEGGSIQAFLDAFASGGVVDHLDFNTTPVVGDSTARLVWNDTDGTLNLGLKGGNVTLQLGQEQVLRALNKTGADFVDGQAVYISGAQGNRTTVALADADLTSTHKTIGIVTEHIANNQEGFVTINGLVRNIDTSAWGEGDQLWVSTTAGALTNVKPAAPKHSASIGYVVRSHAVNGSIFVTTQSGMDLSDLDDVSTTGVANNDALIYDSGTTIWTRRASTGTGSNVLATSPVLVTPNIGAATGTSVNLTSSATASAFIPIASSPAPTQGFYSRAADTLSFAIGSANIANFTSGLDFVVGSTTSVGNARLSSVKNADALVTLASFSNNDGGTAAQSLISVNTDTSALHLGQNSSTYAGSAAYGNAGECFVRAATSSTGIYINSAVASTAVRFGIGSVEKARLTTTGLGIGTTAPATNLHISSTTPKVRVANITTAESSFGQSSYGVELTAGPMGLTSKYTPGIKFGSTDSDLTTTNPKFGAAITGVSTETYSTDNAGGMALTFWTQPNAPGTTGALAEVGRFDQDGQLIVQSNNLVLPKTAGKGIKVDVASPTFPWRDITSDITTRGTGGGGATAVPDFVAYRGNIYQYRFGTNAPNNHLHEAFINYHIPHDLYVGSDLYLHVHWSQIVVDTGGTAGAPGNAKWYFDVSYADGHGTAGGAADPFVAPITVSVVQQGSTTAYGHMIAEVQISNNGGTGGLLDSNTIQPDGVLLVRLYRDPADAADTLNQDTFVHFADTHYQSTNIGTRNKTPPFWT